MDLKRARAALRVLETRYEELLETVVERTVGGRSDGGAYDYTRNDDEAELAQRVNALRILIEALRSRLPSTEPRTEPSFDLIPTTRDGLQESLQAAFARRGRHRLTALEVIPGAGDDVQLLLSWHGPPLGDAPRPT